MFTPLKVAEWDHMLAQHPDKQYVPYLLSGIQEGFWIGYERREHVLGSARKNMKGKPTGDQGVLGCREKARIALGPL